MNALKHNLFKAIDFLIRVESGPDAGKAYRLQPPKITVGRDPKCQITLEDPKTSRRQLVIHFSNNVYCEDLSSRKTTHINGKPCSGKTILRPGDKITFGQTTLCFMTRTNENAQPQLSGQAAPSEEQIEKLKGQKKFRMLLAVIVVLALTVFLLEEQKSAPSQEKLATSEDLMTQIEESEQRMSLVEERAIQNNRKINDERYLYSVEKHFISGFRDFQNGRYGRALDSFGTTIATEPTHTRAQLYSKTARKKRADLIDTHMRDGQKYKDKMMYNRCASEFEKSLVLINNVNSKKYEYAKTQLKECRMLKTGGYQ